MLELSSALERGGTLLLPSRPNRGKTLPAMKRHAIQTSVAKGALRATAATILSLAFFAGPPAKAAIVATYGFTGNSLASSDADPQSTAGNISGGISGSATFQNGFNGPALRINSDLAGSSQSDAITNGKYVSFTITPGNGLQLGYSALSYNVYVFNNSNAANGTIEARWSLDSFATTLVTRTVSAGFGQTAVGTGSGTLSAASGSPVEVRFYFFSDVSTQFTGIGIDDISLTAVAVPKPSSLALFLLGGSFLARRNRTRLDRFA